MFDESEGFQNIINLIKMKFIFSSTHNNSNSSSIMEICMSILFIGLLSYIGRLFSSDENINIFDLNLPYTLQSFFRRENKVIIEGKKCFKSGYYVTKNNNIFSFSFSAIWYYVGKHINTLNIHSIKECEESDTQNTFGDANDDDNMDTEQHKYTYIVNQKKPFLIYDGIYCSVQFQNQDLETSNGNSKVTTKIENIQIKLFSYDKSVEYIRNFIEQITNKYVHSLNDSRIGRYYIYTYEGGKDKDNMEMSLQYLRKWNECQFQSTTTFENIFFEQKKQLLHKIDFFTNNKAWYEYYGKPYTLGIGLSGPPGTGKTSIIKSIANKLKRNIIVIPLNKIKTIQDFTNVFYENRYAKENRKNSIGFDKKIIVFEDIDCMSEIVCRRYNESKTKNDTHEKNENNNIYETTSENDSKSVTTVSTSEKENESEKKNYSEAFITSVIKACKDDDFEPLKSFDNDDDKLTLSFILNIIDGIRETPGRILIITSNFYEKLDKALIRPGRIDICLQMKLASREIIHNMFNHFYTYTDKTIDFMKVVDSCGYKYEDIPNYILSQAEIVQCFDNDPKRFIENIMQTISKERI